MNRSLVLASLEDAAGDRCVDIFRLQNGQFAFRKCRRGPEDSHGWRYLSAAAPAGFDSEAAAREAAYADVAWMRDGRDRT